MGAAGAASAAEELGCIAVEEVVSVTIARPFGLAGGRLRDKTILVPLAAFNNIKVLSFKIATLLPI